MITSEMLYETLQEYQDTILIDPYTNRVYESSYGTVQSTTLDDNSQRVPYVTIDLTQPDAKTRLGTFLSNNAQMLQDNLIKARLQDSPKAKLSVVEELQPQLELELLPDFRESAEEKKQKELEKAYKKMMKELLEPKEEYIKASPEDVNPGLIRIKKPKQDEPERYPAKPDEPEWSPEL